MSHFLTPILSQKIFSRKLEHERQFLYLVQARSPKVGGLSAAVIFDNQIERARQREKSESLILAQNQRWRRA